MATKTTSDVVTRALRILRVIGGTETPDGDVSDTATDEYTAMHEDMRVEYAGLYKSSRVSWNKSAVPEEYFAHVAGMLAGRLADIIPCSERGANAGRVAAARGDTAIRRRLARNNPDYNRFDPALNPQYNSGRLGSRYG